MTHAALPISVEPPIVSMIALPFGTVREDDGGSDRMRRLI